MVTEDFVKIMDLQNLYIPRRFLSIYGTGSNFLKTVLINVCVILCMLCCVVFIWLHSGKEQQL